MYKPASLRDHLTSALPDLRRDPDKLAISIQKGTVQSTAAPGLSNLLQYTLRLLFLDYAGHVDAITVPLLAWLRRHQPELLDNPDLRARAVRFEVDFLNAKTVDLQIELDLSERVIVTESADQPGRLDARHPVEPALLDDRPMPEHWELYLRDQLLASWDLPAS